jgi:cyclohexanone monooxygenase
MENFNVLVSGGDQDIDLVADGWTDIFRSLGGLLPAKRENLTPRERARAIELADFQKMNQVRARVDAIVKDKKTAEALKPWYRQFCKRPCFHDEYLDAFNRPNVHLIDTDGKGVERITERGIVANGKEYEIDCLIYATGFEVGTSYTRRAGYELYGRDGISLSEKWQNGVSTLHGMHSRGFPNCFIISNSQSGFTANFPHMLNEQSKHLSYIIKECTDRQVRVVEAAQDAEDAWVQTIISSAIMRQRFQEECTPGYYNNEGKPSALAARNGFYGLGPIAFVKLLEDWRSDGTLKGLELNPS